MKVGCTLQELAKETRRQRDVRRDFLADTSALRMTAEGNLVIDTVDEPMRLLETPHSQLGTYLDIPRRYYQRLQESFPGLLADSVNTLMHEKPERRMVRALDGNVRAFLSDRYRTIDNYDILDSVLPILCDMPGLHIESCQITEQKMYLKAVNQRVQTEIRPGDVVQAGIAISNSEVGLGSVRVEPLVFRLVCTNGMIAADHSVRKYHVGRANQSDEGYEFFRDETIRADERAFALKLQDTVRIAAEKAKFEVVVDRMRVAAGLPIVSKEIPKVVALAAKDHGMTEKECSSILDHLIRDGDFSLYGLSSAVTRTAQDAESYDRATILEATGWHVLNTDEKKWTSWNMAA